MCGRQSYKCCQKTMIWYAVDLLDMCVDCQVDHVWRCMQDVVTLHCLLILDASKCYTQGVCGLDEMHLLSV